MKKIIFKTLLISGLFFLLPLMARADVCNQNTVVDFVARDPYGTYIPNAQVDIYKQEMDANNRPKPTTHFAGASTSSTLGIAQLSFRNGSVLSDSYVFKVKVTNHDDATFWFYNNTLSCGQSVTIEKTLSGVMFSLHEADGSTLKNTNFSVYSQLYSSGGSPLKETRNLITNLNTGSSGQAKIYLPQGSVRGLSGYLSDHYAISFNRPNSVFSFYNIAVSDGLLTGVDYYLSALRIKLQNSSGNVFPPNTKVEVYKQIVGLDNDKEKGTKMGEFSIGDNGYGTFEVVAGVYVLGVKGENNQYQYFWDIEAESGRTTEYTVTASQAWTPSQGSCQNNSQFVLNVHDFSGNTVAGLKFELYEQSLDSNGLPTANSRVGSGTLNSYGQGTVTFRPDPRLGYAIKIWDKRADLGEYWFYDAVKFVCDYNRTINKVIPALHIVLRDQDGNLKRNYDFSLYGQRYDADGNPTREDRDLISNLKTDSGGQALVYVSPYNTYRPGQTGAYAIRAKDSSNNYLTVYNIKIQPDRDYTLQQLFSGVSGKLTDAFKRVQADKELRLYEQINSGGVKILGKKLLSSKTDSSGNFRFDYTAGTYALTVSDQFNQENAFWNVNINNQNSSQELVTNLTRLGLSQAQSSGISGDIYFKLYKLVSNNNSTFYRDKEIANLKLESDRTITVHLASGPYLAVYVSKSGTEFGKAFYAQNGKLQDVTITISRDYLLQSGQTFKLTVPSYVSSSSSNSSSSASSSAAMASRLKGRILLQVQDKGQAWYVNPDNQKKYYLGRPADAFNMMRTLSLGISNSDFAAIEKNPPSRLYGKILLKVQDNGRAYYVDPVNKKLHYLGRPADAFNIMRTLGLGITNSDLNQITTSN